mmetsp:Transcript_26705/g.39677  ORF Transcript_26705/g.39677 Transcript_26705/m.39677 type:complete len:149 (-) Transcript_26705:172-618(-)
MSFLLANTTNTMVRIINGEIVQDDDPRVHQSNSSSSHNIRQRGIRDLHSIRNQTTHKSDEPRTPNNPTYEQHNTNQAPSDPMLPLSKAMGIHDKFITIPAVPSLGISETRVGLIYFVLIGVLFMIFGTRSLLFALIIFVIYKHSERQT